MVTKHAGKARVAITDANIAARHVLPCVRSLHPDGCHGASTRRAGCHVQNSTFRRFLALKHAAQRKKSEKQTGQGSISSLKTILFPGLIPGKMILSLQIFNHFPLNNPHKLFSNKRYPHHLVNLLYAEVRGRLIITGTDEMNVRRGLVIRVWEYVG